jgi:hypothetical protein
MVADRLPLRRAPRFNEDDEPRYWHPNGWVVMRETRDWDARGLGGLTCRTSTVRTA